MSFSELLQVVVITGVLTLALTLLLYSFWRRIKRTLQGCRRPRYLKPRGVRRCSSGTTSRSKSNEPL